MGTYHPLTEYQRYQIFALKKAGHDQLGIAATVGVSPSTICRELRRNRGQAGYQPGEAHQHALARRRGKAKATKMTPGVIQYIEAGLYQQWSPEQIAGFGVSSAERSVAGGVGAWVESAAYLPAHSGGSPGGRDVVLSAAARAEEMQATHRQSRGPRPD